MIKDIYERSERVTFLYIVLGIALFFTGILSVPFHITVGYDDKIRVSVRYLFIKLDIKISHEIGRAHV